MLLDFPMTSNEKISAFILAGGQSTRMGTDKATVMFDGKPMVEHVWDALSPLFKRITLVSNHVSHQAIGLPIIKDAYDHIGPLGGIIAGLRESETDLNLFIGCDMPMVRPAILDFLIAVSKENEHLLPSFQGKTETLCSILSKSALPTLERAVSSKNYKLYEVLMSLNPKVTDVAHLCNENPFANINTPSDLK